MKSLKNKTVWITGASPHNYKKLYLPPRSVEKLNAIKDSLKGHLICPMDLSKTGPSTVKKVVAKAKTIDVLVNNAGISEPKTLN